MNWNGTGDVVVSDDTYALVRVRDAVAVHKATRARGTALSVGVGCVARVVRFAFEKHCESFF